MILIMPRAPDVAHHDDRDGHDGHEPVRWTRSPMAEAGRGSARWQITMGPVTTGGKKRMTRVGPNTLNSADSTRYRSPEHATPRQAYGNRSASPLGAMAAYPAMKANDDPRNAGTFPFESRWNNSVPTPANSSVVETGRPVSDRHQDRRAEHGEHVLQSEDRHLRRAELARIVNCIGAVLGPHGRRFLFAHLQPLISRPLRCRMLPRSVIRRARLREPLASCHKFAQCAMPKRPSAC